MTSDSGSRAERQDRHGLSPKDGRTAPVEGHRPTSGANLTPSGVERIRAEAFEEAAKVAEAEYLSRTRANREAHEAGDRKRGREQASAAASAVTIMHEIRALALPSEPPSQGDVEGRARELAAAIMVAVRQARFPHEYAAEAHDEFEALTLRPILALALASKADGRP